MTIGSLFSEFASRRGFIPLAAAGRVGDGPVGGPPTIGRTIFRLPLISRLVRRAFSAQPADDLAGDGPAASDLPDSDCWPMEIVTGQVSFHVRSNRP